RSTASARRRSNLGRRRFFPSPRGVRDLTIGSLWAATAEEIAPALPRLEGERRAQVAVVGGGFTGLSTAIHLRERGIDVAVLEAETVGWGASGRNGGQVIPGLKHDPPDLVARFGAGRGEALAALAGGAADRVFALIERFAIACEPV